MFVKCCICGVEGNAPQEELISAGWLDAEGEINGKKFVVVVCPKHENQAEIIAKEIGKVVGT